MDDIRAVLEELIRLLIATGALPWWGIVALAIVVAILLVKMPALRAWLRTVKIIGPAPPPDPERDPDLPPAQIVDGEGRPVGRREDTDEPSGG